MMKTRLRSALLGSMLLCAVGVFPAQASADSETRWGIGSALINVLYLPAKVTYAATGAVFGGIAWGLSGGDRGVAEAVIDPAIHGDYLVTPAHLRRERRLEFVASGPRYVAPQESVLDRRESDAGYRDDSYDPYDAYVDDDYEN